MGYKSDCDWLVLITNAAIGWHISMRSKRTHASFTSLQWRLQLREVDSRLRTFYRNWNLLMTLTVIMGECPAEKSRISTVDWWILTKNQGECEMRHAEIHVYRFGNRSNLSRYFHLSCLKHCLSHQEIVWRCYWELFLGKKSLCYEQEEKI